MRCNSALKAILGLVLMAASHAAPAQIEQRCVLLVDRFEDPTGLPQFHPVFDQAIPANAVLEFDIDTSSPGSQLGLIWRLPQAPPGMSIDESTGVVTWVPTVLDVGVIAATVIVTDPQGRRNRHTFCVEVIDPNSAPRIAAIADRAIVAKLPFTLTVEATDPDEGDELSLNLDAAPAGMTLDLASGLLEWLPELGDIGEAAVTVRATDPAGHFDLESFTLTVIANNAAPVLDPIADRGARVNALLSFTATASDADGDELSWSLPQAPAGMAIDSLTGQINWTPVTQQLGPNPVTVRVADPLGFADQADFSVFVDFNRPPVAIDDSYRVERGDTLVVPAPGVLANDEDPNDDPLTAQLATGPQRGSLTLNADGSFDYTPDNQVGTIGFAEKWNFSQSGGLNYWPPIVANIDDDPQSEILMIRGATASSVVIALDGISGEIEWQVPFGFLEMALSARPAIADLNGDGRPELLIIGGERHNAPSSPLRLIALSHDGHIKWISEELPQWFYMGGVRRSGRQMGAAAITVADLDGDGIPEIIVAPDDGPAGFHVWDHEGRTLASVYQPGTSIGGATRVTLVDLDLDGDLEIVVGDTAWHHDGTLIWSLGLSSNADSTYPIVVNLDDDPYPELVRTRGLSASPPDNAGDILAINHDGSILWEASRPGGSITSAFDTAPMTAADVNGDGYTDILRTYPQAVGVFEVLDGRDGSTLWSKNVPTLYSGATAIDLDGDGFLEVVLFSGDGKLYVWDGRDGAEKAVFDTLSTAPSPNTVPVFADIDADGRAELILSIAGSFSFTPAVIVYESPNDDWPPMRAIWNQMRYHVTNINDDLSVPAVQRPHWLLPGLNQYMINERLPEARVEDADSFTYRASDGEFESNEARVDITIFPPNSPPRILSTPRTLASPGFEYVYNVLAVDADVGELLSWSIGEGPDGMVVNEFGSVSWTPTMADLGRHTVVIRVSDSVGAAAFQNFLLDVVPAVNVPNLAGRTEAEAVSDLAAVSLTASPILDTFSDTIPAGQVAAQNPAASSHVAAGANVRIDVSRGPVPIPVPRMVGFGLADALDALANAGLTAGPIVWVNEPIIPRNVIAQQNPPPQTLVAPTSPVTLTVSGGPRAILLVDPPLISSGQSAVVSVEVRDVDGTPLDPQPAIDLMIEVDPFSFFGPDPTLIDDSLATAADSQGSLLISASFSAPNPEVVRVPVAVLPPISDGPGGSVYSDFTRQQIEFGELIEALIAAIDAGDIAAVLALDQALADLEAEIDLRRLRTMTVVAPEAGVLPTPDQGIAGGLLPKVDDSAFVSIAAELVERLRQIEALVLEGTVSDQVMNQLNQNLGSAAAALAALDPSAVGVLRGRPWITALLGTQAPGVLVADIRAVRQALAEADRLTADGAGLASARFTLPGIMTAVSIRNNLIKNFYVPYLGQVARALGVVIAADLLQPYVNGSAIVAVISGASQAIHVFDIPNSAIEGFGLDPILGSNAAVTMIGPDLINSVIGAATSLVSASSLKDANSAMDSINQAASDWNRANSVPGGQVRGCLFDGSPGCGQLVYPDGFSSVYKLTGGFNLPAPVLIIARNLESGGSAIFIANFVPTREEE